MELYLSVEVAAELSPAPVVEPPREAAPPPAAALMMTMRVFIYYFVVELLWGVPNHYGLSSEDATRVIGDILKHGMLRADR